MFGGLPKVAGTVNLLTTHEAMPFWNFGGRFCVLLH
jgi:hypothetical protein